MAIRILVTAVLTGILCCSVSTAEIIPVFQVTQNDVTWTAQDDGAWSADISAAEDYRNEIWERPIKDAGGGLFTEDDGVWTTNVSGALYRAFNDLKSGGWGVGYYDGTNDGVDNGKDYLFAQFEAVGQFTQEYQKSQESAKLSAQYYFYFQLPGQKGGLVEMAGGKGETLTTSWSDKGDLKLYVSNDLNPRGDPNKTYDDDSSSEDVDQYGSDLGKKGQLARIDPNNANNVQFAIPISDFGQNWTRADFENQMMNYVYLGLATSNPSATGKIFANDHFSETVGSGQEYDTLMLGSIPEPSSIVYMGVVLGVGIFRRRR